MAHSSHPSIALALTRLIGMTMAALLAGCAVTVAAWAADPPAAQAPSMQMPGAMTPPDGPPRGKAEKIDIAPGEAVLKINGETYTRKDIEGRNPNLFDTQPHASVYRAAWIERFVSYRLLVQEARKSGLAGTPEFARRRDTLIDLQGAGLLLAEAVPEEPQASAEEIQAAVEGNPGKAEADIGKEIIEKKRREAVEKVLAAKGISVPVTRVLTDPQALRSGREPAAVAAEVGGVKLTVGDLRAVLVDLKAPGDAAIGRMLEEMIWGQKIIEAARLGGWRDKAGSGDLTQIEDKLLEELMIEKAEKGVLITEDEVRKAYDLAVESNAKKNAPALLTADEMRPAIIVGLKKDKLRARMRDLINGLLQEASVWKNEKLQLP